MRNFPSSGKVIIAVSIAAVAVGAGTAWAAFTSTGSASTTTVGGSVIPLEAIGAPANGAVLYPGVRHNITIAITNRNPFQLKVIQVGRATSPTIVDPPHASAGCVESGVSLASASYTVFWTVPANSTQEFTLPNGIRMTNASDSACQGASFTVPITVTGVA